MYQANSWRELLSSCIANHQERQRISDALGVRPITLTRWANGESNPRIQHLQHLITILPQHRSDLIAALKAAFPILNNVTRTETGAFSSSTIPSEFYMRVLQTRASIPKNLRYPALCDLILQQTIKHLDPERVGIGISIARCLTPATGNQIRSLLADIGRGTPPWGQHMEYETMLLGAESLAGYATNTGHLVAIADLFAPDNLIPASIGEWEKSAVAAPISFEGCIAGSIIVSCTQVDYFDPVRMQLISNYADLIALTLDSDQFYDPTRIQLHVFPPQQEQRELISTFQQLTLQTIRQAAERQQYINVIQAGLLVWQQIEEKLLQWSPKTANRLEKESYHGT